MPRFGFFVFFPEETDTENRYFPPKFSFLGEKKIHFPSEYVRYRAVPGLQGVLKRQGKKFSRKRMTANREIFGSALQFCLTGEQLFLG